MATRDETIGGLIMGAVCAVFIAAVLGILGAFSLQEHKNLVEEGTGLPDGATQIVEAGSGWVEFTYKNQRFLYRKYSFGDKKSECIVRIDESDTSTSR